MGGHGKDRVDLDGHGIWVSCAVPGGERQESLLPRMGTLVDCKEDVEVAGQQRRDPVLDADAIPAVHRAFDLMKI